MKKYKHHWLSIIKVQRHGKYMSEDNRYAPFSIDIKEQIAKFSKMNKKLNQQ